MDDSDTRVSSATSPVIPTNVGIHPLSVLIVASGLLVLVGAGCVSRQSSTSTSAPLYTQQDVLNVKQAERSDAKQRMLEYTVGVRAACEKVLNYGSLNLEPAERMLGTIDDKPLKDFLEKQGKDELRVPVIICGEKVPTRDGAEGVMYFTMLYGNTARIAFWKIGETKVSVSDPITMGEGYDDLLNLRLKYTPVSATKNNYKVIANTFLPGGPYDPKNVIIIHEFDPSTSVLKQRECAYVNEGTDGSKACANFF